MLARLHCKVSFIRTRQVRVVAENRPEKKAGVSLAVIIAFAALGGFSLWYWGAPNEKFLQQQERYRQSRDASVAAPGESPASESAGIAQRYASAVRAGDCARAIELTWWMQERLRFALKSGKDAQGSAMEDLCSSLKDRTTDGSRLRPEGIEDQYVFAPLAQVAVTRLDAGRQDLVKPVMERVWIHVSYPVPTQALRDDNGTPIKSLTVGVNVSTDGYVLKGGVIGNLEIDFESISYNW